MIDDLLKLVPVVVFFSMTLILAFLVLLSPAIIAVYPVIDAQLIIIGMIAVVAITSATVGLIVHKVLFLEHAQTVTHRRRAGKR